jgi:ATP-dependent DNA helicase RecQ
MAAPNLLAALKQHFGYDSFRPLQEQIIRDALDGRDVFALLPTGGGKSLCFQLPAILREGLTVVVSPLIALMKDQVDALTASGVAATFLNSTLDGEAARARLRGLHNGEYRLLYVAPERLMLPGFLDRLDSWSVAQVAIDEAHCISEWGHDFRPEYRQLAELRDRLPGVPMMALTATATERVREDIVQHLGLHEPRCYVASFNRPNLSYRVMQKERPFQQTLAFAKERSGESGIIYCQSRKSAEGVAERLSAQGIRALPYHAGLDAEVRSRNQELFIRDEVRVVCATIAFGMGINKPNVRYVLHYDLPKNIEGYYQETGRAGRDGLPSECVLLFSAGDVVKQTAFIDEKPDPEEQARARALLQQMVHYAESAACRRATLLSYFGEEFGEPNCGACDNCLSPRESFDGTVAAQKFLSCIIRLRQASRSGMQGFGLNHLIDVLAGAENDRIRKWDHQRVSTYGIGREHSRSEWQQIGRELIRLGLCRQTADKFPVIELTQAGMQMLKERAPVKLSRPVAKPDGGARERQPRRGDIACDEVLFTRLRGVRKELADARDVPAYVIFSDVSLRLMAREYPVSEREFSRISGVGEKKLREFGEPFMRAIREHLSEQPRIYFDGIVAERAPVYAAAAPRKPPLDSARESMRLFRAGMTLEEVARQRELSPGTVTQHLVLCIEQGDPFDLDSVLTAEQQAALAQAFSKHGLERLVPVMDSVGPGFSWEQLHLFRAVQRSSVTVK